MLHKSLNVIANEQQQFEVMLVMRDTITGETVTRTIDSTNAMEADNKGFTRGWKIGTVESQRTNLETWIRERGNSQHDAILDLIDWVL